jgi:uncharacterized protein YndB with AHSA1/START domain
MNATAIATRSVIIEREMPHPPEKIWRALTESQLISQWLMKNDFQPTVGHRFQLRMDPMPGWDGIVDCEVLTVEPPSSLSYGWKALGVDTVVAFTLTPTAAGTKLKMEQSGFRPNEDAAFKGAQYGWQGFIGGLERVAAELG